MIQFVESRWGLLRKVHFCVGSEVIKTFYGITRSGALKRAKRFRSRNGL